MHQKCMKKLPISPRKHTIMRYRLYVMQKENIYGNFSPCSRRVLNWTRNLLQRTLPVAGRTPGIPCGNFLSRSTARASFVLCVVRGIS